jgi:hypothetical protein
MSQYRVLARFQMMGLDGKISADEVYFQKSDFDFIPVVARSHLKLRIRMGMPLPEVTKEKEKFPRKNPDGSGRAASRSSISKKKK